jgi:hypothetical protein
MVVAWSLVALAEWAAAVKRMRWRLDEIAPPVPAGAPETTGPWNMPVVEATVVDEGPDPESKTIVATLPTEPEEAPPEAAEAAPAAPRRRRFFGRRGNAAQAGADPWEA